MPSVWTASLQLKHHGEGAPVYINSRDVRELAGAEKAVSILLAGLQKQVQSLTIISNN